MIPPRGNWVRFSSDDEKLKYMVNHKLISAGATFPKALIYSGGYTDRPIECKLIGYVKDYISVIELKNELHCINTDYLTEMQAGYSSSLAPEKYVVLDLETTGVNHKTDAIIEVAAVKYEYGEETDIFEQLVNPLQIIPEEVIIITGITNEDVQSAPQIAEVLPQLMDFLGDLPIVAHNAPFDKSFLLDAYKQSGLEFKNPVIDTLKLARKAFPTLESHALENLKRILNLQSEVSISHRALPDVYTAAELYRRCNEELRNSKIDDSVRDEPEENDFLFPERKKRKPSKFEKMPIKIGDIVPTVEKIEENNPLFGKSIVFTGDYQMSREEAMQLAINCGAIVKSSVSRKTDFLVIGSGGPHSKERTARELNDNGKANIKFLTEEELLEITKNEVTV